MQDIENNMDDLFRKAADKYTPNPGDSGWDAIEPQLLNQSIVSGAPVVKNIRKKNKALLLLLLLPLAAGVFIYHFNNNAGKETPTAVKNVPEQNQSQQNQLQKNKQTFAVDKGIIQTDTKNNIHQKDIGPLTLNSENIDDDNLIKNNAATNVNNDNKTTGFFEQKNEPVKSLPVKEIKESTISSGDSNTNITQLQTIEKTAAAAKQKRFYIGIVLGSDFNQVKNQGFKKVGLTAGIIAGYKLSKNISVETGLQYKKKYYFSDGKYFDMTKTISSMPAGMQIVSLNGSSNVLEIPLSIKYNVKRTASSSLFTAAGISSYILLKENNNYTGSLNGVQEDLKRSYKNLSTGFASSVDLSIGYEHAIGKQNSFRIQPFLQIPLKGMGVGNMQVMSTGINIAVTGALP